MDEDFETHFTVMYDHRLADWAAGNGLKYTRIELDRGTAADQPMLTGRGRGDLPGRRAAAGQVVDRLREDGFTVRRVKIEAAPWHPPVPSGYFEHHVKLVLTGADLDAARAVALRHGAHLSRNARRTRDDGRHERFVTQRCHDVDRAEARRRLDALLAELPFAPVEVEEEYVVLDDNPELDAGWIR